MTQSFSNYLITSSLHPYLVMLIVLFFYWAMGTFMDPWALLIVSLPIFFPIVTKLGFDPLHFGVLCALTVMIGNVSPPVGVTIFALRGVCPDIRWAQSLEDVSLHDNHDGIHGGPDLRAVGVHRFALLGVPHYVALS